MARHSGFSLPLFSAARTSSWGIGELSGIAPLARWTAEAGGDRLMLLPIGMMAEGETSPYSAASAMAIDPIYIAVGDLPDFVEAGGESAMSEEGRAHLAAARAAERVAYASVRRAKREALERAFASFVRREWEPLTGRASALASYIARERWWLDDHALFQALSGQLDAASWRGWPPPLRDREPQALEERRRALARQVLFHQYLQWIAETEWQTARADAASCGVAIIGDLPFVVNSHSADVWARAGEFLLDVSVGVPPDAFSENGQDWGLPAYRWEAVAASDFAWIRQRARRMATLFDGFRVDHLVGFFRTYGRPTVGEPCFSPADEGAQRRQGEQVLRIFLDTGAEILAEDLGTVPDFVRASLSDLGVAGCKVLRWERDWRAPGQPFIDPANYPPVSVALTGTHDTETLAGWWDAAPRAEREAVVALPFLSARGLLVTDGWSDALRDALLELMYRSGSNELLMPLQDVFGWRARINIPGTVGEANWSWLMPWPVDRLREVPEAAARAAACRSLARAGGRGAPPSGH